jgi:alkylation response protein AidB-like acyl-CoA dehydrogenase
MSYFLTEEQELVRNSVRQFADEELRPVAARIDKDGEFPTDLWRKAAELGYTGVCVPEELGGLGADVTTEILIMEEIGKVIPTLGLIIDVNLFTTYMILGLGTDAQKAKYVPDLAKGVKIGALSSTEAPGSINYSEWAMGATKDNDGYIFNATKIYNTNSKSADIFVVRAKTPDGMKRFIIDKDMPGLETGYIENKLGLSGSDTGTVKYNNVRIPAENILPDGDTPLGLIPFLDVSAISLGIAEEVYARTFKYLSERTKAGKKIIGISAIGYQMAQMATKIEFARNFVYNAARLFDEGRPDGKLCSMSKAVVCEMAVDVCRQCIELHGAVGYCEDAGLSRYLRDAIGLTVAEVSTNIQWAMVQKYLRIPVEIV